MPKQGEIDYLKNIGKEGVNHASNKPYSDENCGKYFMDLGVVFQLLPPPPAKLLDLGCGTGWTSCIFAKRGYEVTGQDIAADMIDCANSNKERERIANIKFIVSDYEDMRFDSEFDCAVFYDSLHHAVNEETALKMVYKALKPGGICVAVEPGKNHDKNSISQNAVNKYGVTEKAMHPGKVVKLSKKIGFSGYKIFPRIIHIGKAIYDRPDRPALKLIFKLGILRSLAAIYIILFRKKSHGITLLVK
ncbi:MAG: class I SAM-dependent methyltransferase [Elusimicrobiota bacterium]